MMLQSKNIFWKRFKEIIDYGICMQISIDIQLLTVSIYYEHLRFHHQSFDIEQMT